MAVKELFLLAWLTVLLWTKLLLLAGIMLAGLIIAPEVLVEGVTCGELDLVIDIGVELLTAGELVDFRGVGWMTFSTVTFFRSSLGFIAWAGKSMY